MTKIASISLDIRKNSTIDNDPIVLRQGDSDVIIEASISNDGYPDLGINFATFVAKKPDGTIISNDPANVNGNTISYPISKHLTESAGKIQDAYFMINNEVTTNGFDISIIPSTQLDDTSIDYIPGIENINKFLESAEADWLGRIQQMKTQIDGLNVPDEFKLLMDKALSDAKAQYQPTIDAAEANIENIVADLAAKKLDLTNNSDELNQTISNIKAQVAPVNSFLDGVQKQIIDANSNFTAGQQAQISQSIADSQKKLADSIASMQSEVAQTVADLKSSSNSAIADMQSNQSTAMAKVNQDITDTKAIMQEMKVNAVGTNLLLDSQTQMRKPSWFTQNNGWTEDWGTYLGSNIYRSELPWNNVKYSYKELLDRDVINTTDDFTYSIYFRVVGEDPAEMSYANIFFYSGATTKSGTAPIQLTSLKEGQWTRVVVTFKFMDIEYGHADDDTNQMRFEISAAPKVSGAHYEFAAPKLEKGSVATDYSLNPEDILGSEDVQTEIANQIKANQPDLSGFQKASDVQTAISNALSNVNAKVIGQTITATDDTGKTVKLKITGIS